MRRWAYAAAVALVSACSSGGDAVDPEAGAKQADRQHKDCADPEWKAAHLGIWYTVCRSNGAVR